MPKGIPNATSKDAMRAQIAKLEAGIQLLERREKALTDLAIWLEAHGLERTDLLWLYKRMAGVKLLPLPRTNGSQPPAKGKGKRKGDAEFRHRVIVARKGRGWRPEDLAKRLGVSGSTVRFWEAGQSVPTEKNRLKIVSMLGLPAKAGAAATKAMEATQVAGRATH